MLMISAVWDPELACLIRLLLASIGSLVGLTEVLGEGRGGNGVWGMLVGKDGGPLVNLHVLLPPVSSGLFNIVSAASTSEGEGESGRGAGMAPTAGLAARDSDDAWPLSRSS